MFIVPMNNGSYWWYEEKEKVCAYLYVLSKCRRKTEVKANQKLLVEYTQTNATF